jgi:phenylacetate-CoA ligase
MTQLDWGRNQLKAHRTQKLRELLHYVKKHSPWYKRRFAHLDPEKITADDLSMIPPMTKKDMLEHWDEITVDSRLTYEGVNQFLRGKGTRETLLYDRYHVFASGGS